MHRSWLLFALPLVACSSTEPSTPTTLRISGHVQLEGLAPTPQLPLTVVGWLRAGGDSTLQLATDSLGAFTVTLPPATALDSVDLVVHQYDCGTVQDTRFRYRAELRAAPAALQFPQIALSYRLPRGELGLGATVCGTLTSAPDDARLALWFDQVTDSVHGRWRLNFRSSRGDEYGYFHGTLRGDTVMVSLLSQPVGGCTGLALRVVAGERTGAALFPASFEGNDSCLLPSTTVRFFQGATLTPLLPAWPGP